jgi:hypothetical protein
VVAGAVSAKIRAAADVPGKSGDLIGRPMRRPDELVRRPIRSGLLDSITYEYMRGLALCRETPSDVRERSGESVPIDEFFCLRRSLFFDNYSGQGRRLLKMGG